jgi:transcriptional regulator with XRE-family HTH domain
VREMLRKGWKKKRKLTRDEYAKKCGVSKMAISKAVRSGKVIEDDRGFVDITNEVNRAYMLSDHSVAKRARAAGVRDEKVSRAAASKRAAKRAEEKHRQWMDEHKAKTAETNAKVAKALGLLVERATVERMISAFGSELKMRLLGLPRQFSAELFDLAHTKGATPMALEGRLLELTTDALKHCKEKAREVGLSSIGD